MTVMEVDVEIAEMLLFGTFGLVALFSGLIAMERRRVSREGPAWDLSVGYAAVAVIPLTVFVVQLGIFLEIPLGGWSTGLIISPLSGGGCVLLASAYQCLSTY